MSTRTGLTRGELITAAAVLVLVVIGVLLVLPGFSGPPERSGATPGAPPMSWDDASLEASRRSAGLPACPTGDGVAPGPLAAVSVPCLGAPGVVRPAAGLLGRDALVTVWASWCAPCRVELPALAEYAGRPGAVPVLGVDARDRPDAALALLADLHVALPVVGDPDGALSAALRVPPGLPASFLLHADGRVSPVRPPVPFRSADEVAAAVARLRTAGS